MPLPDLIEIVPLDPNNPNPQQVPIGCFDANHNALGPDDWVFGFTRVYAYNDVANANPTISSIDSAHSPGAPMKDSTSTPSPLMFKTNAL